MRKIFAVLLFLVLYLPMSCNDSCDGQEYRNIITELSVSFGVNERGVVVRESVPADSAVFFVMIEEVEEERIAIESSFVGFTPMAMAEDCPFLTSLKNSLIAINITSDAPIQIEDRVYEAGALLNDLFYANFFYDNRENSVNDLVQAINEDSLEFSFTGGLLNFQLNADPNSTLVQSFQFEFIFDDRTVTTNSGEVSITVD